MKFSIKVIRSVLMAVIIAFICICIAMVAHYIGGNGGDIKNTELFNDDICSNLVEDGLDKICAYCRLLPPSENVKRSPRIGPMVHKLIKAQLNEDFWEQCLTSDACQSELAELCQDLLQTINQRST